MRVETPQILWNSEGDTDKNAPLYSVAMIESGMALELTEGDFGHVLVTAGNTPTINLWRMGCYRRSEGGETEAAADAGIFQRQSKNRIEYMTSLTRHEMPVNAVAFSPDGLHLATAGEAGTIIVWSVPVHKRGNGNGRHFWSTVTQEKDLSVRIASTHAEGVCDISWSADSKRFVVGTIDSQVLILEDKHYANNQESPETLQKESEWQIAFRNGEHSSFVQGVAYDPLGVYIASMGSDRTVRVFPRKIPPKSKKKVLRPSNAASTSRTGACPPPDHQRNVARLLTESKLDIGKTRRIQQICRTLLQEEQEDQQQKQTKQRLFVDESTCESFFRRLSWTTDGAFLVTPAALWHNEQDTTFATYLFARHKLDEPCKVLPGLEKPSVVVRPNPVLFQLPESSTRKDTAESKENQTPNQQGGTLEYRSIFAVLTLDSVLVYDTHHTQPLSIVRGLHYTGLTDCCWTQDGHTLLVCSTDGYISIINFQRGELGHVYRPPEAQPETLLPTNPQPTAPLPKPITTPTATITSIPPCKPGTADLEARPAKKSRISPTPVTATTTTMTNHHQNNHKRCCETESVGVAVNQLSLQPKKKKRVQPLLISS